MQQPKQIADAVSYFGQAKMEVVFAEFRIWQPGRTVAIHTHSDLYHVDIFSGPIHCSANGENWHLKDWNLLIIPPGYAHGFVAERERLANYTLKFRVAEPLDSDLGVVHLESASRSQRRRVEEHMQSIIEDWQMATWGYKAAISARLSALMIDIFRCRRNMPHSAGDARVLEDACRYMAMHYSQPISVKKIADHCGIRADSLSRQFQKKLHTTPIRYLLNLRIRQAQVLLRSGYSITQTAESAGFSSVHYFSRVFHHTVGKTPSTWARQSDENQPIIAH